MLMLIYLLIASTGKCLNILMTTLYPVSTCTPINTRADDPFPKDASTS